MGAIGDGSSGRSGRRRSLDSEIPLVPFIDLLLCCVMFLLVTAAWKSDHVLRPRNLNDDGLGSVDAPPSQQTARLLVERDRYVVQSSPADAAVTVAKSGDAARDRAALRRELALLAPWVREIDPAITLSVADGVAYREIIGVVDSAMSEGMGVRMGDIAWSPGRERIH